MANGPHRLPPTSPRLRDEATRPYFLWWLDATVGDLRRGLRDADLDRRAYWMGALLREANTRDVWLFVSPGEIRPLWPRVLRHLGRSRPMWAWLLELPAEWPPAGADFGRRGLDSMRHLRLLSTAKVSQDKNL